MLKDFALADGFPMDRLAECTTRFSSSDLKELCRNAAMAPVREFVRRSNGDVAVLRAAQDKVRACPRETRRADADVWLAGL